MDDYIRDKGIRRVDFIKCDVEGAELNVLRGAEQCLRTFSPAVLLETESDRAARFGNTPMQVLEFMARRGYRYSVIREDGEPIPSGGDAQRDLAVGRDLIFRKG